MHQSAYNKHADCKTGQEYCFDWGKYTEGVWSGFGQCSSELQDCCWNEDADPIDKDPSNCPKESKCPPFSKELLRTISEDSSMSSDSSYALDLTDEHSDCIEVDEDDEDEEDVAPILQIDPKSNKPIAQKPD